MPVGTQTPGTPTTVTPDPVVTSAGWPASVQGPAPDGLIVADDILDTILLVLNLYQLLTTGTFAVDSALWTFGEDADTQFDNRPTFSDGAHFTNEGTFEIDAGVTVTLHGEAGIETVTATTIDVESLTATGPEFHTGTESHSGQEVHSGQVTHSGIELHSGAESHTGAVTFSNVTAPTYKLPASSVTRDYCPARWQTNDSTVVRDHRHLSFPSAGATRNAFMPLPLPHGATNTTVTVTIQHTAASGLPSTLPTIYVYKIGADGVPTEVVSAVDPSATLVAYRAKHTISATFAAAVDRALDYEVLITNAEGGVSEGIRLYGARAVFTPAALDNGVG